MTQIVKSIRIIVAALACLWPLIFFTGLPASASVLAPVTPVLETTAPQGIFQHHEASFFLDTEPATVVASAGESGAERAGGAIQPQRASSSSLTSLATSAFFAVLLLAAFNARKRRSRPAVAQH